MTIDERNSLILSRVRFQVGEIVYFRNDLVIDEYYGGLVYTAAMYDYIEQPFKVLFQVVTIEEDSVSITYHIALCDDSTVSFRVSNDMIYKNVKKLNCVERAELNMSNIKTTIEKQNKKVSIEFTTSSDWEPCTTLCWTECPFAVCTELGRTCRGFTYKTCPFLKGLEK